MPVTRNRGDSGVGDIVKTISVCCKCGAKADIPEPVKNMYPQTAGPVTNQRYITHPGGNMLCWKCYESTNKHWSDAMIDEMIR